MKGKMLLAGAFIGFLAVGSLWAEDVQWVRVTVLLERGSGNAQRNAEALIPGGIYSLEEVERRGQDAIDREILNRVRFLAAEISDVEQSMRLGTLLPRQYYLPLRVGQQAVVPVIDLNPRLGIVISPQRFVDGWVVCRIQFLEPEGPSGITEFTGEPISLRLQDAELQEVLKVFEKITPFTIEIDPSVTGKVTVDLRNVRWDQALDLVLRTNNLGWTTEGDTLRIAPLDEFSRRKKVRTEATVNLARGDAGSATVASRGDAENRTVVLVIESVAGEPYLVAERDGLVHPPAFAVRSRNVPNDSAIGDVLVFRGRATEDGDLEDFQVLASPFPDNPEALHGAARAGRPWTVLDEQVRRIGAVVGYGLRITHLQPLDAVASVPVERIGVEVKVGPPPAGFPKELSAQYVIEAFVTDLDTGREISAPRIAAKRGNEATVRSSFTAPSGDRHQIEITLWVAEDGCNLKYSWKLTSNGKVLSSHEAEFEL